jgi:very-short-patch-repair endonuclease
MNNLHANIHARGGVAATFELLRDGYTSHQLTAAVRRGEIVRVRQGHYTCPELSPAEQQAIRVGGRLTGASGAEHHGIWAPRASRLTVAVKPNARALRTRTDPRKRLSDSRRADVSVAWSDAGIVGTRSALDPLACVLDVARTESPIVAFGSAESALFQRHFSLSRWRRALDFLPATRVGMLRDAGTRSESGGESMLKYRMLGLHIPFAQQVRIAGVGRVDLLVGRSLVIEVDGAEFHTSREAFERDRHRDAVLSALGFRVLRFSYTQVASRWPEVAAAIEAAMGRGDHLG